MSRSLLISVRFLDGRYHGAGDWPPAPARFFQALVAGTARGAELTDEDRSALEWLEKLDAPVIAVPTAQEGQSFKTYVPNNDLDKFGGDPRDIGRIRTSKTIRPYIFDAESPTLFIWTFDNDPASEGHARTVCQIAERLYQLGRGVDMAWAWAEFLDTGGVEACLSRHGGIVYRPSKGGTGNALPCPRKGSLKSLQERFETSRSRLKWVREGGNVQQLFSQPPKPYFAKVVYGAPMQRFLFETRATTADESFVPWPSTRAAKLVEALRDRAARRLREALPEEAEKIDRVLIGRGATAADKAARVRIVPLPSIGHAHADRAIRRVLVELPPNCPLRTDDVTWAFSGIEQIDPVTEEVLSALVQSEEQGMLDHYGVGNSEQQDFRVWRTVTPAVLPVIRTARSVAGTKRVAGEAKAAHAVLQALRHTGVTVPVESVRVQREPFDLNGDRADMFVVPKRFGARGVYHVEVAFTQTVPGTLVIGDGRYLGLGLMAPKKGISPDAFVFSISPETRTATSKTAQLLHAVRRALMALSRDANGHVPRLFSGHENEGTPAQSGGHKHVFLAADDVDGDGCIDRFIVAAPWVCDRTTERSRKDLACFASVSRMLTTIRAGRLGVLSLGPAGPLAPGDPLVGPSPVWESRTVYRPTRHTRRGEDMDAAVVLNVIAECQHRGLPKPSVELLQLSTGPNGGNLSARLRLRFAGAVTGPIMLGQDSHKGGGLFAIADDRIRRGRKTK